MALAQNTYVPDEFDYLNHNYKYLDSNFNISIDSSSFNETIRKYKFIEERIITYRDSLSVVLMTEFGDWRRTRIAELRINYSWERVGHHLWKKENEIRQLGKQLNIEQPYRLQELFYYPEGNITVIKIIEDLRKELIEKFESEDLKTMDNANLMKFAFNRNPDVLNLKIAILHRKSIERFKDRHGRLPNESEKEKLGLSCGAENCCQLDN